MVKIIEHLNKLLAPWGSKYLQMLQEEDPDVIHAIKPEPWCQKCARSRRFLQSEIVWECSLESFLTYVNICWYGKSIGDVSAFLPVVFWIPMRIFFISSPKKLLSFQHTCYILWLSLMTFETNSFSGLWSHLHLLSLWWNEIWPKNRSKRIPWLCSLIILLYYIFVHTSYTHVHPNCSTISILHPHRLAGAP